MSLGEGFLEIEDLPAVQVNVHLYGVAQVPGQFLYLLVVDHFHLLRELQDLRVPDLFLGELVDEGVPLEKGDGADVGVAELGRHHAGNGVGVHGVLGVMDVVWATTFAMSSGLMSGWSSRNFRSAPMVVCLLRQVE